jgi:signal transduction histidine kinase
MPTATAALTGLRQLRAAVLALALLTAATAVCALPPTRVEWTATTVGTPPAADADWTPVPLPLRWRSADYAPLQGAALRVVFRLDAVPSGTFAVLFGQASAGGTVELNGRFIGAARVADPSTHVRWRRPHLFAIDPTLLVVGDNTLLLQTAYLGGNHAVADVRIGPLARLQPLYERQFLAAYALPWVGAALAAAITVLFGVLWLRRPERLLGLLTVAAALWIFRSGFFLVETMPAAAAPWLRLVYYGASGGFAAAMTLTLLQLSGRRERREDLAIIGYALLGPALLIATGHAVTVFLDQVWLPGLVLMAALGYGVALDRRIRGHDSPHLVLLATVPVALAAAVHDLLASQATGSASTTLALHWAGPLLLVALAAPLADRFVWVLREAESARAELESRVREREQLLKRNFERLRESERLQAQAQERQRIMQDMHDGLGSQLLSSLMLVERGAVSQPQMVQILRESIDDMRLAIDALASDDAGLLAALGNLRFRMEPRLNAAGIQLAWVTHGLPEEIDINPKAVLPILRIVQEALTNALKHSRARLVQATMGVERQADGDWLAVRIADNGGGIVAERAGGRGLLNMRNRAARIGAVLKVETVPGAGTAITLRYRLDRASADGPTTGGRQLSLNTEAVIERARRD